MPVFSPRLHRIAEHCAIRKPNRSILAKIEAPPPATREGAGHGAGLRPLLGGQLPISLTPALHPQRTFLRVGGPLGATQRDSVLNSVSVTAVTTWNLGRTPGPRSGCRGGMKGIERFWRWPFPPSSFHTAISVKGAETPISFGFRQQHPLSGDRLRTTDH